MKRITRLLTAPPARARWGAAIGTTALLVSGVLLVTQVGLARQGRQGIHIKSNTDGALKPGDKREISAYGKDGWRHYTAAVGKDGKLTETLEVDGKPAPVTAETQRWITQTLRLNVPPAPPAPPAPPTAAPPPPPAFGALPMPPPPPLPALDALPMPPPPPAPPEIQDLAMFKRLLQQVAGNAAVIGKLGSPVAMASKDVDGSIRIGNGARPDGEADLTFTLRGPKGQAAVHVDAQLTAGEWSSDRVDVGSVMR